MEILAEPTYRKFSIAVWKNYEMPTARYWQTKDSRKNTMHCSRTTWDVLHHFTLPHACRKNTDARFT